MDDIPGPLPVQKARSMIPGLSKSIANNMYSDVYVYIYIYIYTHSICSYMFKVKQQLFETTSEQMVYWLVVPMILNPHVETANQ